MSIFRRTSHLVIASIVMLGLGTEVHAQASDVDCDKCVNGSDISGSAVGTSKIQKKAVTSGKLAAGAVTSGKIKNGAVTFNKLSSDVANSVNGSIGTIILEQSSASDGSGVAALLCPTNTLVGSVQCDCDYVNGSRNFGVLFSCQTAGNGGVAACFNYLYDAQLPNSQATVSLVCVSALQNDGTPIAPTPLSLFPSGLIKIDESGMDFETAVNKARSTVDAHRESLTNR